MVFCACVCCLCRDLNITRVTQQLDLIWTTVVSLNSSIFSFSIHTHTHCTCTSYTAAQHSLKQSKFFLCTWRTVPFSQKPTQNKQPPRMCILVALFRSNQQMQTKRQQTNKMEMNVLVLFRSSQLWSIIRNQYSACQKCWKQHDMIQYYINVAMCVACAPLRAILSKFLLVCQLADVRAYRMPLCSVCFSYSVADVLRWGKTAARKPLGHCIYWPNPPVWHKTTPKTVDTFVFGTMVLCVPVCFACHSSPVAA